MAGPRKYADDFWPLQEETIIHLYTTTRLSYGEIAKRIGRDATLLDIAGQVRKLIRNGQMTRRLELEEIDYQGVSAVLGKRSLNTVPAIPPSRPPRPLPAGVLDAFEAEPGRKPYSFDALPACGCRWPVGEGFCGSRVEAGSRRPYCQQHVSRSLRAAS